MFEFSGTAGILLHPSILLFLLCMVGLLCCLVRKSRGLGRAMLLLAAASVVIIALPPGNWPLEILEDRFPEPIALPSHVDGIIVLGGAINLGVSAEHGVPSLKAGSDRMTTFLALARHFPEAKLVFTGGVAAAPGAVRESDVARDLFAGLGLDSDRVTFERHSQTTWENALLSKRLVQPEAGEIWLLVTSAVDIPRAVGCFRHVGWSVMPWPAGYQVARNRYQFIPSLSGNLANLDWATHEWIGLIYYKLRGWTDTWFPGPDDDHLST